MTTCPDRRAWLRLLAIAPYAELARAVAALGALPPFEYVREPEIGLAMVRGRTGADGLPFNVGEMTVTRCSLRVMTDDAEQRVGVGIVAGRVPQHAEAIALCDALLQSARWRDAVDLTVLEPLRHAIAAKRAENARRRAATKAEFVTVVRSGES